MCRGKKERISTQNKEVPSHREGKKSGLPKNIYENDTKRVGKKTRPRLKLPRGKWRSQSLAKKKD